MLVFFQYLKFIWPSKTQKRPRAPPIWWIGTIGLLIGPFVMWPPRFLNFCNISANRFSMFSSEASLSTSCKYACLPSSYCVYLTTSLRLARIISSWSSERFSSISSTVEFWESKTSQASEEFCYCDVEVDDPETLMISAVSRNKTTSRLRLLPFLLSLAKSTLSGRPLISYFLRLRRAEDATSGSLYRQKPNPLGCFRSESILSRKMLNGPAILKVSWSSESSASYGILPKNIQDCS